MVGDDKGRENLGDYGDFWGIFFDFFAFVDFFCGGGWEQLGALGALGLFGVRILGALGFWRRWWGLGLGWGWR